MAAVSLAVAVDAVVDVASVRENAATRTFLFRSDVGLKGRVFYSVDMKENIRCPNIKRRTRWKDNARCWSIRIDGDAVHRCRGLLSSSRRMVALRLGLPIVGWFHPISYCGRLRLTRSFCNRVQSFDIVSAHTYLVIFFFLQYDNLAWKIIKIKLWTHRIVGC